MAGVFHPGVKDMREKPKIMVVDDEPAFLDSIRRILHRENVEIVAVVNPRRALQLAGDEDFDLIVSDLRMPEMDGLTLLRELKSRGVQTPVVMMTGYGSIRSAVEAMKEGAIEYITKPLDREQFLAVVKKVIALPSLRKAPISAVFASGDFHGMIGRSEPMKKVYRLVQAVAATESTVLVQGETGTGKELVARAIHDLSRRSGGPFMAVNCAAISEGLFESSLFGHVKGAFTGALNYKEGFLKSADGGTLFLDEIGDMPLELQSKLLRVLQDGEMFPVGLTRPVKVDIRLVAATNQDLEKSVREKRFREDLFYRLHVIPISLPPLRERGEDIVLLVDVFLGQEARKSGKEIELSSEALSALGSYSWPGNVRELRNVIERTVTLTAEKRIESEHLPEYIAGRVSKKPDSSAERHPQSLERIEKQKIEEILNSTGGNKRKAAQLLGISRATLYRKLRQWGLS